MEIKICDLNKEIQGNKILNDINLTIESGKCTGLIGPNGAGKTTLFRILLGLYDITSGEIFFGEQNRMQIENPNAKILFMFDSTNLFRNLSVRQNIEFFYKIYCSNDKNMQQKIDFILDKINLMQHANSNIKSLSRGMRQRLSIGRTMVCQPNFLLLDEPYLALDVEAQIFLTDYICELKKHGCTIFISSHDLNHMEKICDKAIFIKSGKIICEMSSANDLETHYKNLIM